MAGLEPRKYVPRRGNLFSAFGKTKHPAPKHRRKSPSRCRRDHRRRADRRAIGKPGLHRLGLPPDAPFFFGADLPALFPAMDPGGLCRDAALPHAGSEIISRQRPKERQRQATRTRRRTGGTVECKLCSKSKCLAKQAF